MKQLPKCLKNTNKIEKWFISSTMLKCCPRTQLTLTHTDNNQKITKLVSKTDKHLKGIKMVNGVLLEFRNYS